MPTELQDAIDNGDLIHSFLNVPDGKAIVAAASLIVIVKAARKYANPNIEAATEAHWLARGYDLSHWIGLPDDIKQGYLRDMKTAVDAALGITEDTNAD